MPDRIIQYDGTKILKRYDPAEISVIIDEVNLLVLEHLEVEVDVIIKCKPGKENALFNLEFNVPDCTVEPVVLEDGAGKVTYKFKSIVI